MTAVAVGQAARIAFEERERILAALAAAGLALVAAVLMLLAGLATLSSQDGSITPGSVPGGARPFVRLYTDAAKVYAVNRFVLMAIHENETDYGRSTLPGVRSGVNSAGCCAGPMQFSVTGTALGGSGGTWATYRTAFKRAEIARPAQYPNRLGPHPSVYDSFDAIYASAAYLHALGADRQLDRRTFDALLHYTGVPPASIPFAQHDFDRARELEELARQDRGEVGPLPLAPGGRTRLLSNGLAAAPQDAPPAVRGMVAAANAISDRPYLEVHYATHIGNPTYDCSSATSHVLWGGGRFGTAPWVSGDLMRYGEPGPGRWVTIYAHTGHVFLYVAGLRFDTSRYDSGPNASESGPRWRTGARPLAGFVVRHPRGL